MVRREGRGGGEKERARERERGREEEGKNIGKKSRWKEVSSAIMSDDDILLRSAPNLCLVSSEIRLNLAQVSMLIF